MPIINKNTTNTKQKIKHQILKNRIIAYEIGWRTRNEKSEKKIVYIAFTSLLRDLK